MGSLQAGFQSGNKGAGFGLAAEGHTVLVEAYLPSTALRFAQGVQLNFMTVLPDD